MFCRRRGAIGSCMILATLLWSVGMLAVSTAEEKPAKPAAKTEPRKKQADKSKPKSTAKKAPANPLTDLIKNIFGKKGANPLGRIIPQQNDATLPTNGDRSARDHIDARAPHDPRQAALLRKAKSLRDSGDWKQALEVLNRLLNPPGVLPEDSISRAGKGQWTSARAQAIRLIGDLPPEALDQYRLRFGGAANQMLNEARRTGNLDLFVQVANRYFHTHAGHQAANHLGSLHFDRGEFAMAARWFRQLSSADAPFVKDDKWRIKAALAFRRSGLLQKDETWLKDNSTKTIELAGKHVDPRLWLDQMDASVVRTQQPILDDWIMLYGSASRTGTAQGSNPLLLSRWRHPLTRNEQIAKQARLLVEDLADQNRAIIPASVALTVNGKVVFRTLGGVRVVDAESGRPLWETVEGISPERILSGDRQQETNGRVVWAAGINPFNQQYNGNNVDHHPLTNLLFRNGVFGMLSSDGRQLFVIENHAVLSRHQPGYGQRANPNQNDPYARDWSSNKLSSYNLETGRPLWEVGGVERAEPFDLPLAGSFFHGVPVADGGDLFIIAEKMNEIRLYALDPQSGLPKWSQLIAFSDTRIQQDVVRRLWSSQVSVADGLVICPTTIGWMVAIDRISHSVVWAYRYSEPPRNKTTKNRRMNRRGTAFAAASTLNTRWCPSAPIIVKNRVIFTPSESTDLQSPQKGTLVCLNLLDGNRVWQKPKSAFLYLAGVFDERIVLVGANSVTALSLENGTTLWTVAIPTSAGRPSGRGVAVGNLYHLPLRSGQLWTIDLKDGKVKTKSYLPTGLAALGNLAMYRGMLLSLGTNGLESFEQRERIEARIRKRKKQNPHDPWALVREADIHLLHRDHSAAIAALRQVDINKVDSDLLPHFRKAMLTALTALIRKNSEKNDRAINELANFVRSADEQLLLLRLTAERHIARKEYELAFDIFQKFAQQNGLEYITRTDDSVVTTQVVPWVSGKLADLWQLLSDESKTRISKQISETATAVLNQDHASQEQFVSLFGFHPAALKIEQKLIESYIDDGHFLQAENRLLKLSRHSDRQVAAAATERLARLLREMKLLADSRVYYQQLKEKFPDVVITEKQTVAQLIDTLNQQDVLNSVNENKQVSWSKYDWKLIRTGSNYSTNYHKAISISAPSLPFFHKHRLQYLQPHKRLVMTEPSTDSLPWSLPLRSKTRSSQNQNVVARSTGHRLMILHHDVIHCLSPVERKVLWTRPLETNQHSNGYYRSPSRTNRPIQPMQTGTRVISQYGLVQQARRNGMLAVANNNYVCYYGRRKITVLDTQTGKVRWTRGGIAPYTTIYGSEDVVYVVPPDSSKTIAIRSSDGKPLDIPHLREFIPKAIHVSGHDLVLVEQSKKSGLLGLKKPNTMIRRFDTIQQKNRWKVEVPANSFLGLLETGKMAVFKSTGELAVMDLETGEIRAVGKVSQDDLKSKTQRYIVADHENIYLILNGNFNRFYSESLPSIPVNGIIVAFSRKTGQQLWKQDVKGGQNMILEQFDHSPVLLFSARKYERQGKLSYSMTKLLMLDKQTGRKLAESTLVANYGFQGLKIDLDERYVELRSYNERVRLISSEP